MKIFFINSILLFLCFSAFTKDVKSKSLFITTDSLKAKKADYFLSFDAALKAAQNYEEVVIYIDQGEYYTDQTIRINNFNNKLTITSKDAQKPIIYGGRKLEGWHQAGKFLVADCLNMDFRVLEINGRFAERSRLPETGTFINQSIFKSEWKSTLEGGFYPQPTDSQLYHMSYSEKDLENVQDLRNSEITLFHMWDESLVRIANIDQTNHVFQFENAPAYPAGAFGINKYVLWNIKEGMTHPGQWYLDRKYGKLYYWPLENEKPETINAIVPVSDTIISISNSKNISFSNLEIRTNNSPLIVGGFGAKWFSGAINFDHCDNLKFENLNFSNLSTIGIKGTNSNHISICSNNFQNTGAGGIRLVGSNNVIKGNKIIKSGQLYPSSIALYVNVTDPNALEEWNLGKKEGNVLIDHNEIHDAPYVAIACGGHDTQITNNKISRVMQILSDGGGIYVTFCKDLKLTGNYVYDIPKQEGYGTCAYYLDELTSNALVENNLSIDVARAMHNHLSENNIIRNNVFINDMGELRITYHRCKNFTLSKNVFIAKEKIEVKGINVITNGDNNILYSESAANIIGSMVTEYEKISEQPIISGKIFSIKNPKLTSTRNGKVQYDTKSVIYEMGIVPLDLSKSGIPNE